MTNNGDDRPTATEQRPETEPAPTTRRGFLAGAAGAAVALAGCSTSGSESDPTPDPTPDPTATPGPTPEADAVLEYSVWTGPEPPQIPDDVADVHRGADNPDGRREEGNVWVVVDVDVVEGALDQSDAWFHGRLETEDRYYEPDHASNMFPGGLQPRGSVKAGSSVVVLFQVPEEEEFRVERWFFEDDPSTNDYAVEHVPPAPSATQTPVPEGEADAVIEYVRTRGKNPEKVPDEYAALEGETHEGERKEGHDWVLVDASVREGEVNQMDLWYNSRLETVARDYELDEATNSIAGGLEPGGAAMEPGDSALLLYQVPEDAEIVEWVVPEGPPGDLVYALRRVGN